MSLTKKNERKPKHEQLGMKKGVLISDIAKLKREHYGQLYANKFEYFDNTHYSLKIYNSKMIQKERNGPRDSDN